MQKSLPLFSLFVIIMVAFSGCFKDDGPAFDEVNLTDSGVLLEEMMPQDTWFAMSFSTLNDDQRENFRGIVGKFTDDPDAFRDEVLRGVDENLASVDLSYVDDIQPVLGKDGFRFLLGLSDGDDGSPVTHVAVTLENHERGRSLLEIFEQKGRFLKKAKGGHDLYFNSLAAEAGEDVFFFALHEDTMLISNNEDELVEMLDLAVSVEANSLWSKRSYQDVVNGLPSKSLFVVYMDSEAMSARRAEAEAGQLGATHTEDSSLLGYLEGQGIAFMAEPNGLDFRGIAIGNEDRIDEDDFSLNQLKAKKAYLHDDMPANKLALYMESYNFAAALERQLGEDGEASLAALGIDPSEVSLDKLFGKGYSLAMHQNSGFLPGLTLMVDASRGSATAKVVLDQLDQQIAGLIALLQFQGGTALSGALSREVIEIGGEDFNVIRLDVGAVMEVYQQTGSFDLPEQVGGEDIVLLYGINEDDRLILSTYEGWLDDPRAMLSDDDTYDMTLDRLEGFKEGVVYVQFDVLFEFVETFNAFREALSADADSIHAENAELLAIQADLEELQETIDELDSNAEADAELGTGPLAELVTEPELEPVDWVELLEPLKSFSFSSKADKYEVTLGGVVLLD